MSKDDILNCLGKLKRELEQQFGVVSIGLFGSAVREEIREDSDIDIAIEMAPEKKSLRNFLAVKRLLENELGKRVDLGIEGTLKPLVKKEIQKEIIHV
jgi:predicted nucleotidyltransferase